MEPQNTNQIQHEQKQDQYNFYCLQGRPCSLTMIKKPKIISQAFYIQPKYFWISTQLKLNKNQMQKKSKIQINLFNSIEEAKLKILNQHKQNIVLIFQSTMLDSIDSQLSFILNTDKIIKVLHYGDYGEDIYQQKTCFDQKKIGLTSPQDVFVWIDENNYQLRKSNEFFNFISLKKQTWDSNILVKTMLAMAKHQSNSKQIIKDFKELALILLTPNKPHNLLHDFVEEYQDKGSLSYNRAISWYTRESFLYGFVNSLLRISRDPTSIFIIQPYFKDLFNGIQHIYYEQQKQGAEKITKISYTNFLCYRKGQISERQVKFFEEHKGLYIQNLGFFSTTRHQDITKKFVGNAIFEIQVDDSQRNSEIDYGFANITQFSQNSYEEQILFNPLNNFKIVDFSHDSNENDIYRIRLKYGQMSRILISDIRELKSSYQIACQMFGQYLIENSRKVNVMGQVLIQQNLMLEGSAEYCKRFLKIQNYSNNKIEIFQVHYLKNIIFQNNGRYEESKQQLLKCLQIVRGQKNQNKRQKQLMINIGLRFEIQGRYKQAIKWFEQSSKITGNDNERNHLHLNHIAMCYRNQEMYEKSIQYSQKYLQMERQFLKKNDCPSGNSLDSIASSDDIPAKYLKNLLFLQKNINHIEEFVGKNHQINIMCLNNLGYFFGLTGNLQKSLQFYQKSYQIQRKSMLTNHPDHAITLSNMGFILFLRGKTLQALSCLQKSKNILQDTIGKKDINYLRTLTYISFCYCKLNQIQKSFHLITQCQKITRQILGKNSIHYSVILNHLAFFYLSTGNTKQAMDYFQRNLKIQRQQVGQHQMRYYEGLGNLAWCFIRLRQFDKALELFEECERQLNKLDFPNSNIFITTLLICLFFLNFIQGTLIKAKQYAIKCGNQQLAKICQIPQETSESKRLFWGNKLVDFAMSFKQAKCIKLIQEYQKQKQKQNIFYTFYFDRCVGILSNLSSLHQNQFSFSLYQQLLSLITLNYKQEANQLFQTIKKQHVLIQHNLQFKNIINQVNNLFIAMQCIWSQQKEIFVEKFNDSYQKLFQYVYRKKISIEVFSYIEILQAY